MTLMLCVGCGSSSFVFPALDDVLRDYNKTVDYGNRVVIMHDVAVGPTKTYDLNFRNSESLSVERSVSVCRYILENMDLSDLTVYQARTYLSINFISAIDTLLINFREEQSASTTDKNVLAVQLVCGDWSRPKDSPNAVASIVIFRDDQLDSEIFDEFDNDVLFYYSESYGGERTLLSPKLSDSSD
jgi:hypothetical protein